MAAVDPYSPCPCGSGQKFKWCCHKVEAVADKSQRLYDGGQTEAALAALDEGLKKEAGNAWLLSRKALILIKEGRPDEARQALDALLSKNPTHLGGLVLQTRLVLESEGASAGAAQLQKVLTAFTPENRRGVMPLVRVVGAFLSESADYPAALRHLRLAAKLAGGQVDQSTVSTIRMLESSPNISPWLKNDDRLSPAPAGLTGDARTRFDQALAWAEEGLWASAASAFELLASEPAAVPAADRNAGLCRAWVADDLGAVTALRRAEGHLDGSPEAVDVEAMCQQLAPAGPGDLIEHIQLTWPVRNRQAVIDALNADPTFHSEGTGPVDEDDPDSPEAEGFAVLDRPDPGHGGKSAPIGAGLKLEDVPKVLGRVYVGPDTASLEAHDDGRLDRLSERLTTVAAAGLAPAHPRTKVLGKVPRVQVALTWEWLLPEGLDPADARRLTREHGTAMIRDVWVNTPMSFLRGRTPLQAAEAGDAVVPLRAAVMQLEQSREVWRDGFDFQAFRDRLHLPAEPELDPETVDVTALHIARLGLLPFEKLSDDRLVLAYLRARRFGDQATIDRVGKVLVDRPEALKSAKIDPPVVYTDLALAAAGRDHREEAFDWVRRGRQSDAASDRARNAPVWDMLELRLRTFFEEPEVWAPELAVMLDRYHGNQAATDVVMLTLVDLGLLRVVNNPDRPGDMYLDPRPLQALMAEYGPRVTTASGRLGVSAAKPEIWTPGSEAGAGGGGGGGIWTPGSASGGSEPGGEKKIIITGR